MEYDPLYQFEIVRLVPIEIAGIDASFTNASLMMVLTVGIVSALMIVGMRGETVPGRVQSLAELSYEFVANLIRETVGQEGRRFFPFVFALFMFILVGNMLGMIPYSFTFTSHIIVTFALAMMVFIGVTILGFYKHGMHFFSFFVPPGTPLWMWPLLIPIEIFSYLSRPITLAVRLFANMMAGQTLMKVIGVFVGMMGVAGVLPFSLLIALTGLKLLIAFLQAYVFAILTCIYINDALHLH